MSYMKDAVIDLHNDLFSQERPVDLHLSTKGCHFPYEVFVAYGFSGEWVPTANGDDELYRLLQSNFMYTRHGRYYVCGDDVPMYLSHITTLPETISARDVTDIVQEFRERQP
jgi:hypothetical protein